MAEEKFKYLKLFFMIVGIITVVFTFLFIAIAAYFIFNNPLGVEINPFKKQATTESEYDHPLLSNEQEDTLQSLGVDLETVPTSITPEQEACGVEALGQERVNELLQGATPSVTDYLKAQHCLE